MTWMQAFSGAPVDLLEPKPEQILLGDIAHALARINRFSGNTIGEPWSVAQHSCLVESLMPPGTKPEDRLAALLHDAHEAYVGDMPSPVKIAVDRVYTLDSRDQSLSPASAFKSLTMTLDKVIYRVFGIEPSATTLQAVNRADMSALHLEKIALMAPEQRKWGVDFPPLPDPCPVPEPVGHWTEAMEMFLGRFRSLQAERHGLTVRLG